MNLLELFGTFDERELRLIDNCIKYAENDPAGLPGHNLMIIVSKMSAVIKKTEEELKEEWGES